MNEKMSSLKDSLHGNILLRFMIEGALDVFICIALQFKYSDISEGLSFDSVFLGLNTIMAVVFATATALFIPFLLTFYLCSFKKWKDASFENRFGTIFDGLRRDRRSSLFYPIFLFSRRLSFTVVVFFAIDNLFLKISSLVLTTMIGAIYLLHCAPFEHPTMLRLEVFNEITAIFLLYALLCFSDAN